jgi:hypothetical protein
MTPSAPRVVLDGLDPSTADRAEQIVRLLGARPVAGAGAAGAPGGPVVLALTADPGRVPELRAALSRAPRPIGTPAATASAPSAPAVVVLGERGTLRIPGDEALLGDLVSELVACAPGPSGRGGGAGPLRTLVVAVAGWQGGVGTTRLALLLARRAGGALVDAAGAGPGAWGTRSDPPEGVRWADLRADEVAFGAQLADHLPRVGPVRLLGPDPRGGAHAGDPRLRPVLEALRLSGDVVVDLGRWDDRAASACSAGSPVDAVCLAGRGDQDSAVRLAGSLGAHPVVLPALIAHAMRRPSPVLGQTLRDLGGDIGMCRMPGGRRASADARRTRRIWQELRRRDADAWIASWREEP